MKVTAKHTDGSSKPSKQIVFTGVNDRNEKGSNKVDSDSHNVQNISIETNIDVNNEEDQGFWTRTPTSTKGGNFHLFIIYFHM